MGRPKKEIIPTKKCLHCGTEKQDKEFYKLHNNSDIYIGNENYIPVCKSCVKILYEQYKTLYKKFSILDIQSEENSIEKLAISRLCMTFDIYYSDRIFDAAKKNQEKVQNIDLLSVYMRISNLKQNKGKSYDDTILEENMSQELVKDTMVNEIREKFNDDVLYQDIYALCLKLMESLKKNCNVLEIMIAKQND